MADRMYPARVLLSYENDGKRVKHFAWDMGTLLGERKIILDGEYILMNEAELADRVGDWCMTFVGNDRSSAIEKGLGMPETKTFKNPKTLYGKGIVDRVICVHPDASGASISNPDYYPVSEWDVVVTLTRKPDPIKVGDRVYTSNSGTAMSGEVMSIYRNPTFSPPECWAWVLWGRRSSPATIRVEDLKLL